MEYGVRPEAGPVAPPAEVASRGRAVANTARVDVAYASLRAYVAADDTAAGRPHEAVRRAAVKGGAYGAARQAAPFAGPGAQTGAVGPCVSVRIEARAYARRQLTRAAGA